MKCPDPYCDKGVLPDSPEEPYNHTREEFVEKVTEFLIEFSMGSINDKMLGELYDLLHKDK